MPYGLDALKRAFACGVMSISLKTNPKVKMVLRGLGILLGVVFLLMALMGLLVQGVLENKSIFTFVFMGVVFLIYGATGKSELKEWKSQNR